MRPPPALVADGDLAMIGQRLDFLGVNYYSPVFLRAGDPADLRRNEEPARSGVPGVVKYRPDELERTTMGYSDVVRANAVPGRPPRPR